MDELPYYLELVSVAVWCLISWCGVAETWLRTQSICTAMMLVDISSPNHCTGPLDRVSVTANVFDGAYAASALQPMSQSLAPYWDIVKDCSLRVSGPCGQWSV